MASARPPTEAFAIRIIAQRIATLVRNNVACPVRWLFRDRNSGQIGCVARWPAGRLGCSRDLSAGRGGRRGPDGHRRRVRGGPDALGAAAVAGGRAGGVRRVAAAGRVAAGVSRTGTAGGGADRAEPAGLVRVRAGVRAGPVRAAAVVADQRGLVRVGGAGRGRGADLRHRVPGPATAARAAVLACAGGGVVGGGRGAPGPVAVRVPLGPAGHEPVGGAGRPLGGRRRGTAADLPGRADQRDGGPLPVDPVGGAPTTTVAAIQGNVPRARNLPQLLNDSQVTQNQIAATAKLADEVKAGRLPAPDVVIWPEDSTGLDPREYPFIYTEIMGAVQTAGKPILVGEVLTNPERNVGQLWVPGVGPTTFYV